MDGMINGKANSSGTCPIGQVPGQVPGQVLVRTNKGCGSGGLDTTRGRNGGYSRRGTAIVLYLTGRSWYVVFGCAQRIVLGAEAPCMQADYVSGQTELQNRTSIFASVRVIPSIIPFIWTCRV